MLSIETIVRMVDDSGLSHVVLTGGEPLLPKESTELCRQLRASGRHVTIETAGTIDRELECDLMSISPKFASSAPDAAEHPGWNKKHEERRMPTAIMRRLIERSEDYQLKFVVDSPEDYSELQEIVAALDVDHSKVWVMPQGSTIDALDAAIPWLKPWVEENGYRYCDRMQIRWFGNRRGT